MKVLILFLTILVWSSQIYGQTSTVDYRINGVLNPTKLSKSDENVVMLEGTGCDRYTLSASGISISKFEDGYIFTPSKTAKKAHLFIFCIANGQSTLVRKVKFKLVR